MKKYLVFDIGCIECGEDSKPVGIYKTRKEADKASDEYTDYSNNRWGRPEWHGQHSVGVFEIAPTN